MLTWLELALLIILFCIWLKGPLENFLTHARRAQRIVSPPNSVRSKPRSRSRSPTRFPEELAVKAQGVHSLVLPVDQKSKEPSMSLPFTSSTHSTHSLNETITNSAGDSNTTESGGIDPISSATEMPIREDTPYNSELMALNHLSHGPQRDPGFFANAQNIVMNNPVMIESTDDDFMKEFAQHIIQGAELDSSARDPPPRCHPGTRVEIVGRVRSRLRNPIKRVQWLVGPAGVGKSAIMQTVAELEQENSAVFAALFFSAPNGRNDPLRVITTLAYQIALQHKEYRRYIRLKVKANPALWSKSIDVQFTEFVIKPFTTMRVHTDPTPVLMFIDGLDECKGQRQQIRILSLIFDFTTKHPQAPLLWVVASRPEAHITKYLNSLMFYDKEEVSIDSTEACQDVERFLRAEFEKIRTSDPWLESCYRQWPPESQLMKLVAAVLGLFAYAETAIRFIRDMSTGDPISQLQVILDLIDKSPESLSVSDTDGTRPMALLDSLYQYILSQVGPDNISRIEEVLAYVILSQGKKLVSDTRSLVFMCNWIGMLPNVMYGALLQLHSVIYVPVPDDASRQRLRFYHKSFSDFVLDPQRSGLSIGTMKDERHRHFLRSARVLGDIYADTYNPKAYITLSWPHGEIDSQGELYATASAAFETMSSLPDIPSPQIAHALKVLWWNLEEVEPVTKRGYRILFNDTYPELTQLLREDGALQAIPVHLLDLNVIRERRPSIRIGNSWVPRLYTSYSDLCDELVAHLEHAQARFPHRRVRVFIGTKLIGIVEFKAEDSPQPTVFSFMYDFSTIHQHLKQRREGERDKKEIGGMKEQGRGRRKRAKE